MESNKILKSNKWTLQTIRITEKSLVLDQNNKAILTLKKIRSIKLGKVSKKLRRKSAGIGDKLDELFISITSAGLIASKSYFEVMDRDDRPNFVIKIMQRVAELNGAPIDREESDVILQTMKDMGPNDCFSFRFDTVGNDGWYPAWSPKHSRTESLTSAYSNSSDGGSVGNIVKESDAILEPLPEANLNDENTTNSTTDHEQSSIEKGYNSDDADTPEFVVDFGNVDISEDSELDLSSLQIDRFSASDKSDDDSVRMTMESEEDSDPKSSSEVIEDEESRDLVVKQSDRMMIEDEEQTDSEADPESSLRIQELQHDRTVEVDPVIIDKNKKVLERPKMSPQYPISSHASSSDIDKGLNLEYIMQAYVDTDASGIEESSEMNNHFIPSESSKSTEASPVPVSSSRGSKKGQHKEIISDISKEQRVSDGEDSGGNDKGLNLEDNLNEREEETDQTDLQDDRDRRREDRDRKDRRDDKDHKRHADHRDHRSRRSKDETNPLFVPDSTHDDNKSDDTNQSNKLHEESEDNEDDQLTMKIESSPNSRIWIPATAKYVDGDPLQHETPLKLMLNIKNYASDTISPAHKSKYANHSSETISDDVSYDSAVQAECVVNDPHTAVFRLNLLKEDNSAETVIEMTGKYLFIDYGRTSIQFDEITKIVVGKRIQRDIPKSDRFFSLMDTYGNSWDFLVFVASDREQIIWFLLQHTEIAQDVPFFIKVHHKRLCPSTVRRELLLIQYTVKSDGSDTKTIALSDDGVVDKRFRTIVKYDDISQISVGENPRVFTLTRGMDKNGVNMKFEIVGEPERAQIIQRLLEHFVVDGEETFTIHLRVDEEESVEKTATTSVASPSEEEETEQRYSKSLDPWRWWLRTKTATSSSQSWMALTLTPAALINEKSIGNQILVELKFIERIYIGVGDPALHSTQRGRAFSIVPLPSLELETLCFEATNQDQRQALVIEILNRMQILGVMDDIERIKQDIWRMKPTDILEICCKKPLKKQQRINICGGNEMMSDDYYEDCDRTFPVTMRHTQIDGFPENLIRKSINELLGESLYQRSPRKVKPIRCKPPVRGIQMICGQTDTRMMGDCETQQTQPDYNTPCRECESAPPARSLFFDDDARFQRLMDSLEEQKRLIHRAKTGSRNDFMLLS